MSIYREVLMSNFDIDQMPMAEPDNSSAELAARFLDTLSDHQQGIMRSLYGISDGIPKTGAETGPQFGISGSRVTLVNREALKRFRILASDPAFMD